MKRPGALMTGWMGLERFLKDERRIIDSAKERATYLQSKDPDIAKRFVDSFIKEIILKDQVATIHYTIPMPPSGGVEKTYVEELNVAGAVWPIDTPSSGGTPLTMAKVASDSTTSLKSCCPTR